VGNDVVNLGQGTAAVQNLRINFGGFSAGSLSVDKNGRLVRLLLPDQDVEVIRKDLLPSK